MSESNRKVSYTTSQHKPIRKNRKGQEAMAPYCAIPRDYLCLRSEMGKKWPKKWTLAPPGKRGKNGPKNGKIAIIDPFLGHFSHFSAIFSPSSRWGQNPFFGHFFPISGPIWGLYRAIGIAKTISAIPPYWALWGSWCLNMTN